VLAALARTTAGIAALEEFHEIGVRESDGRLFVAMHCVFDGALPIGEVHRLSSVVEDQLKAAVPEIFDVHIHVEPPDAAATGSRARPSPAESR
jgi:divalent metal cation (Fe/Co/Zn/Cd) transporter